MAHVGVDSCCAHNTRCSLEYFQVFFLFYFIYFFAGIMTVGGIHFITSFNFFDLTVKLCDSYYEINMTVNAWVMHILLFGSFVQGAAAILKFCSFS